jgi:hypothetical protein
VLEWFDGAVKTLQKFYLREGLTRSKQLLTLTLASANRPVADTRTGKRRWVARPDPDSKKPRAEWDPLGCKRDSCFCAAAATVVTVRVDSVLLGCGSTRDYVTAAKEPSIGPLVS